MINDEGKNVTKVVANNANKTIIKKNIKKVVNTSSSKVNTKPNAKPNTKPISKPISKPILTNDKEIIFQVIDWRAQHYQELLEQDENEDENEDDHQNQQQTNKKPITINKYLIEIYGNTTDGKTIYTKVMNYKPYFYVLVPDSWYRKSTYVDIFLQSLQEKITGPNKYSLCKWEVEKHQSFTEFTNKKLFTYLKLYFNDHYGYKKYANLFHSYNGKTGEHYYTKFNLPSIGLSKYEFAIYESKLDPLLRFMHERDLKSVGFVKLLPKKYKIIGNVTSNDINVSVEWDQTFFHDNDEILKLKVASFDIECKPEDGISFPQPENPGDMVIQIGTTFNYYGTPDCYYKHIITLDTCDKIDGVDVESYKTEKEVLLAWTKLIQRTNPDIITGYNIFQFDFMYLKKRAKFLGIEKEFAKIGRILNKSSEYVKSKLESSALGDNKLQYYSMEGRVIIDMYKVMQRDQKLSSYKLDDVVAEFIKEKVCIMEYDAENQITKIYTKNTFGLYEERFIRLYYNDSLSDYTCEDIYGKKKNQIIKIEKGVNVNNETYDVIHVSTKFSKEVTDILAKKKYTLYWCQAKDDMPPRKMFRLQGKQSSHRALIAKYCIQDCVLCNILMEKLQVLTNNIGMANVCHVPLSFIFLRGQGIKIYSLVAKKCKEENFLIKDLFKNKTREQLKEEEESRRKRFDKNYVKPAKVILTKEELERLKEEKKRIESEARKLKKNFEKNVKAIEDIRTKIRILQKKSDKYPDKESKIAFYKHSLDVYENLFAEEKRKYTTFRDEIERNAAEDGYEGATVFTPKIGKYDRPITVLDYASLYPSSMIQKNLCISSLVVDPKYDNLPDYNYTNVTYYHNDGKGSTTCRFAKPKDGTPGILPQILIELLDKRKEMRNKSEEMAKAGNKFMAKVLDGLQLAYKVTANSLYGQTGSPVSAIYKKEIAASTTATGREQLTGAKRFVEIIFGGLANFATLNNFKEYKKLCDYTFDTNLCEGELIFCNYNLNTNKFKDRDRDYLESPRYTNREEFIKWTFDEFRRILEDNVISPDIIYGDTDSVFIDYRMKNSVTGEYLQNKDGLKRAINLGILCSTLINLIQPDPQNLQYEKTLWPFIILSKKRYIGNLYEKNPNSFTQKSMGIVLKRRDNAPIVKIIVGGIVDQLINEQNLEGAKIFTNKELSNILSGKYGLDKFIITKTLKGTYANRNSIAHAVLADRMTERDPGNKPQTNDRIPFAYIIPKNKTKNSKQGDFIEHKDFIVENNLPIDYLFYITNQIMKPAVQFLSTVMDKPETIFFRHILIETNRRKKIRALGHYFGNNGVKCNNLKPTPENNNLDDSEEIVEIDDNVSEDNYDNEDNEDNKFTSGFDKFASINVRPDNNNRLEAFLNMQKNSKVKQKVTRTIPKVIRTIPKQKTVPKTNKKI